MAPNTWDAGMGKGMVILQEVFKLHGGISSTSSSAALQWTPLE